MEASIAMTANAIGTNTHSLTRLRPRIRKPKRNRGSCGRNEWMRHWILRPPRLTVKPRRHYERDDADSAGEPRGSVPVDSEMSSWAEVSELPRRRLVILQELAPHVCAGVEPRDDRRDDAGARRRRCRAVDGNAARQSCASRSRLDPRRSPTQCRRCSCGCRR